MTAAKHNKQMQWNGTRESKARKSSIRIRAQVKLLVSGVIVSGPYGTTYHVGPPLTMPLLRRRTFALDQRSSHIILHQELGSVSYQQRTREMATRICRGPYLTSQTNTTDNPVDQASGLTYRLESPSCNTIKRPSLQLALLCSHRLKL